MAPRKPNPEADPPELDKSVNQSTQMAFVVIETMAAMGRPVALAELSRQAGVPKVRVFRFLRTLLQMGYVLQDPETDRYRLSFRLFHLGQAVAEQIDILREARPIMAELSARTRFTVSLSQVEPTGMRILEMVRSPQPVEIVTRPGALLDFHASAQGKIALAWGKASIGTLPLRSWTSDTVTTADRVLAGLAAIRAQGWAEAPNETLPGVTAVSAPVFDMSGALAATLTIAGPTQFIDSPPRPELVTELLAAARNLSLQLGNTEQGR